MMEVTTIALICFCLPILAVIIIAVIYVHRPDNTEGLSEEYQELLQSIVKEIESSQQKEIESYNAGVETAKKEYERQEQFYQTEIDKKRQSYEIRVKELEDKLVSLTEAKSKEEAASIESIIAFYANERARLSEDQETFISSMETKKNAIIREIDEAAIMQQEIVEQHKREEQMKQDKDFYRLKLSEDDIGDVKKLRKIADELHNPTILYKLIYKEYYEKPFTEMVGRVVQGKQGGIGIYKITNIQDGRVYIGQTKQQFKERWRTHLKRGVKAEVGTQNKLYKAMWEEGPENFTFEVMAECDAADLNRKEKEYIAFYKADTWGYNSNAGIRG